ncbi:Rossmann-like and DUF2520 domain-containing protein [Hufsiella ginkgonis]|uniref:DUF2520 domain-containing protein n=1 Tax=Hufsiella ginkgonis TaxID=2695274 RepID=A0A7K1XX58_9SPHI|nr:Rossmann-like and DUF2520 domain-containing protein [Hufsiella ginkgonis]MXV15594.1 DUF2520 domain-containing protein [Hufsiella ginkgonis]
MRITLIGSGNVATHLAAAFKNAGHTIAQVWSHTYQHAALLAYHVKATAAEHLGDLDSSADIFVIAVKDDAIPGVAGQLNAGNQLVVHTSGSTAMDVLAGVSTRTGVIYPLQTISKLREIDFRQVPVAVEGSTPDVARELHLLASGISGNVLELSSEKRLSLHVAAVFACNFTNHLYQLSKTILDKYGLDFDLIRPLIAETAEKVSTVDPASVQTGPAVRNDRLTMDKHLHFLEKEPELQDLYRRLSQNIINFHNKQQG